MVRIINIVRLIFNQITYTLFLISFSILPLTSFTQTSESLLDTNKVWSTVFRTNYSGEFLTFTYKLSGDTIINDKNFIKVLRNNNEEIAENWDLYGFIRQDSTKRIYFRKSNFLPEGEYLLYDFNHNVGDTFQIMCLARGYPYEEIQVSLDSISIISISNKPLKTYYISYTENEYYKVIWIEGIGSLSGFLTNFYPPHYEGLGSVELLCFIENDTVKYMNPNYNTCFYTTVYSKLIKDNPIQVAFFPNPVTAKSELKITGLKLTNPSIEIFNVTGNKLYDRYFDKNCIEFNKYKFKPGLYIYRIYDNRKLIYAGKFIIN